MGEPIDTFGRPIPVEVNLRRAERFMKYSEGSNALIVYGSRMDETTAYHQVTVEVLYEDIFGIM